MYGLSVIVHSSLQQAYWSENQVRLQQAEFGNVMPCWVYVS